MYTFFATLPPPPDSSTPASTNPILKTVFSFLANIQPTWYEANVTGYDYLSPYYISTYHILPIGAYPLQTLQNLTSSYRVLLRSLPNITISQDNYALFPSNLAYMHGTAVADALHGAVGLGVQVSSRLVPTSLFATSASRSVLVSALLKGLDALASLGGNATHPPPVELGLYSTVPYHAKDERYETSVNPAWRRSTWHVVTGGAWKAEESEEATRGTQVVTRAVMGPLIRLVGDVAEAEVTAGNGQLNYSDRHDNQQGTRAGEEPESCGAGRGWGYRKGVENKSRSSSASSPPYSNTSSTNRHDTARTGRNSERHVNRGYGYVNEGDYLEPNWREVFYGGLYEKLLAVKREWDPEGVLSCWKCVGWTEEKGADE
ncbi:MAG: hypothetical protein LQ340_008021 [Diploschistes diacapsis]|nr:MAG: hypothetical protein LQ340_008021 [Diploschistes diacapsis]